MVSLCSWLKANHASARVIVKKDKSGIICGNFDGVILIAPQSFGSPIHVDEVWFAHTYATQPWSQICFPQRCSREEDRTVLMWTGIMDSFLLAVAMVLSDYKHIHASFLKTQPQPIMQGRAVPLVAIIGAERTMPIQQDKLDPNLGASSHHEERF